MASEEESEKDQRTEEATPHKLDQLREQGRIPRSADVGAAAALLAGIGSLAVLGPDASVRVDAFARRALSLRDHDSPMRLVQALVPTLASALVPTLVLIAVVSVAVGLAQTRGLVALSELEPKWERLDPIKGLSRVLPGTDVLLELGKTLLKVVAIGMVAWRVLETAVPRLLLLSRAPAEVGADEVRAVIARVLVESAVAFGAVAALDFFLAWRRFHADARMTKQEVRDEHKTQEGDPHIRAKRRARARQIAKQRAISEVKSATVLVTNPTHLAIALRYQQGEDVAPMVLAKGEDELALRMREEARKHGVPIVENRPVARAMYASAKVGRPIPVALYEAVAQILAHVLRIRGPHRAPSPKRGRA